MSNSDGSALTGSDSLESPVRPSLSTGAAKLVPGAVSEGTTRANSTGSRGLSQTEKTQLVEDLTTSAFEGKNIRNGPSHT